MVVQDEPRYGLPADVAAERAFLSACFIHPQYVMLYRGMLRPADFYDFGSRAVWRAMLDVDTRWPCGLDYRRVYEALRGAGVEDPHRVLADSIASADGALVEDYSERLLERAARRRAIGEAARQAEAAWDTAVPLPGARQPVPRFAPVLEPEPERRRLRDVLDLRSETP